MDDDQPVDLEVPFPHWNCCRVCSILGHTQLEDQPRINSNLNPDLKHDQSVYLLIDWLIWFDLFCFDLIWLIDWLIEMIDCLIDWLIDWLIDLFMYLSTIMFFFHFLLQLHTMLQLNDRIVMICICMYVCIYKIYI